jgi:hypothetical protein
MGKGGLDTTGLLCRLSLEALHRSVTRERSAWMEEECPCLADFQVSTFKLKDQVEILTLVRTSTTKGSVRSWIDSKKKKKKYIVCMDVCMCSSYLITKSQHRPAMSQQRVCGMNQGRSDEQGEQVCVRKVRSRILESLVEENKVNPLREREGTTSDGYL